MTAMVISLLDACRPTRHFCERAAERKLNREVAEFIVLWGSEFVDAHGTYYLMIIRRDLPGKLRGSRLAARAADWVLVLNETGAILTCYRSAKACRRIRQAA